VTGSIPENCYVVSDAGKNSIIIDPGDDADKIIEYIVSEELKPLAIINTHAHHDHTGAVCALKEHFNIPFYLHSKEQKNLKYLNLFASMIEKREKIKTPEIDVTLDNIEELKSGDIDIKIIFTPGHTSGGVSLLIGKNLFTGDSLLKGTIGRTDFPGGDIKILYDSIRKIITLKNLDIMIYPGHGDSVMLDEEIDTNPYIKKILTE
jgi:glyoxylase-like metal-dependent hydrolase (beta-lactamase superfamily II)